MNKLVVNQLIRFGLSASFDETEAVLFLQFIKNTYYS
jgi:hypothetical protein